jgi:hypothetical protein
MDGLQRHPLNAAGDFYVVDGWCIACEAPEREAPDLMGHECAERPGYQCFFRRQPGTPEELERAVSALLVGCCGAVRYGGMDRVIIERLGNNPLSSDYVVRNGLVLPADTTPEAVPGAGADVG